MWTFFHQRRVDEALQRKNCINQSQVKQNQSWLTRTHFPAFGVDDIFIASPE